MATTIGKNVSSLDTSAIQKAVGATVDGSYGAQTTQKVMDFQKANNLTVDGVVGNQTAAAITKSTTVDPNSAITSSNLNPVDKSVLPSGSFSTNGGLAGSVYLPVTKENANKNIDTAMNDIVKTNTDIGNVSSTVDRTAQNNAGKLVDTYDSQLEAEQLANTRNIESMRANPQGLSTVALNSMIDDTNRKSLSKQADIAILKNAANRDYVRAATIADQDVQNKLEPLKIKLDNLKFFYDANKDKLNMTDEEKLLLQAKISKEDAKYKSALELETYKAKAKVDAAAAGNGDANYTPMAPTTYIAKATDTGGLYQIAQQNGLDFEALKAANPQLGANFDIKKGSIINLPSVGNPDSTNVSILAATGLSSVQMNYMTQGTPALARMGEGTRKAVIASADAWARAHGTDTATIQSQYKAYNQVVEDKIKIAANTQLAADDIKMSLDTLKTITEESGLGNVKISNVAKVWAGKQVNDENAAKYAFNLKDLQSAVAYFYFVQRGGSGSAGPSDSDMKDAREAVGNGLATGTITGLESTITKAADRYATIANQSVDVARKAIWTLFDAEKQYKPTTGTNKSDTINTGNLWEDYKKKNGAASYNSPIDAINNWVMTP